MIQRHTLCACVPLALFLAAGLARGQTAEPKHSVVATGTAVVKLRPDAARVTFYLTTLRGLPKLQMLNVNCTEVTDEGTA